MLGSIEAGLMMASAGVSLIPESVGKTCCVHPGVAGLIHGSERALLVPEATGVDLDI